MPKIILVNGPPYSGKDTAWEAYPKGIRTKFARSVKEGTHAAFGLDTDDYDMDFFEHTKDIPNKLFFGKTPRDAYIAYSETFMKPFTGDKGVFGKLTSRWIDDIVMEWSKNNLPELPFIITDSGFREEAEVIVEHFGPENVKLIRAHRKDCNFDNDSRSYVNLDDLGVDSEDVINDNIDDYKNEIKLIIEEFIKDE